MEETLSFARLVGYRVAGMSLIAEFYRTCVPVLVFAVDDPPADKGATRLMSAFMPSH